MLRGRRGPLLRRGLLLGRLFWLQSWWGWWGLHHRFTDLVKQRLCVFLKILMLLVRVLIGLLQLLVVILALRVDLIDFAGRVCMRNGYSGHFRIIRIGVTGVRLFWRWI